ncbi:S66 peptidase family protein [Floridanema evergladense]|uniref:LD-carboxypeptidase n=1 Tax=Floridaenema evergladense BLCC-F167 TaxID=3153639 RepID=A0ABV4WK99_9CYAN
MPNRRHFFQVVVTALSCAIASSLESGTAQENRSPKSSRTLKPARIKPGATVGLVSPAGATFVKEQIGIVQDAVRGLGLVPKLAPHLLDRYGYLAGKDRDRAADINLFFADPEIAAILPIRGDWGCSRILPYLDYEKIRRNPKIIVGFSDLTALLLAINAKTNLITFHGPNGLTSWSKAQTDYFRRVLFSAETPTFQNPKNGNNTDSLIQVKYRIQTITPGKARGRLFGGNLSVLSTLVGSPYLPDLNGAILFLEEVRENIYRVDRWMTHLKLAGVFDRLAGFIFGQCRDCLPDADYGSLTLEEVLQDHIQPLGIPAWYGATIGHIEPIVTLPIGLEVEIDASAGTISMLEPAVL